MKRKILNFCLIMLFSIAFFPPMTQGFAARYKTFATVSMIIERENNGKTEILLQKRQNTGWMDGYWELAACGHVEEGETLTLAAIRELKEELCLDATEENLEFVSLNYNNIEGKGTYCCVYFKVKDFNGIPTIGEPDKCEEIKWFPIDDLPNNIIPIRKIAIQNYQHNKSYCEIGW